MWLSLRPLVLEPWSCAHICDFVLIVPHQPVSTTIGRLGVYKYDDDDVYYTCRHWVGTGTIEVPVGANVIPKPQGGSIGVLCECFVMYSVYVLISTNRPELLLHCNQLCATRDRT